MSADLEQPWLDSFSGIAWASSLCLAIVKKDKALVYPSPCRWREGLSGSLPPFSFGKKLSDKARAEPRILEKWTPFVSGRRSRAMTGEDMIREGRKTTAIFTSVTHDSGVMRLGGVRE